jgi:predicted HTH transcriptional regulator
MSAAIPAIIDEIGFVSTAGCVQKLGISRNTALRMLTAMIEQGVLETTGIGRGTKYRRRGSL